MNKHYLIGTVLLLSTATAGLAVAGGDPESLAGLPQARSAASETAARPGRLILLASEANERDRQTDRLEKGDRRHHEEDEDDDGDEDGERGRGVIPQNGPTNPNAPVPDNGLFNGSTRPKVQVQ